MISLVTTVKNENDTINDWFSSIAGQTALPDEIILVDGGSTDGTWSKLIAAGQVSNRVRVFHHLGNIAAGRNFAISQAKAEIIVVTDIGCRYDPRWFETITAPFRSGAAPCTTTAFGPWLKKDDGLVPALCATATTPAPSEFKRDWLPSSRSVAFRKELWHTVGGYPEWLPTCEDVVFDLRIKEKTSFSYIREPFVFWRPRPTLTKYFKQLYNYTKSEGHARLNTDRQIIRYVVYLAALCMAIMAWAVSNYWLVPLIAGLLAYMNKFWRRWTVFSRGRSLSFKILGLLLLPLVVAWGDLAKMCGWPVGTAQLLSGRLKSCRE